MPPKRERTPYNVRYLYEAGINPILMTDSYKLTHYRMYPPGTRYVGSYLEARRDAFFEKTMFFGLQYLLERYFAGPVVQREDIEMADDFCRSHFQQDLFNRDGWEYILNSHAGRLPVSIKAVPEGTLVPRSNVMLTVENTDPYVPWLTNHLETVLVQLWYACTVATISYYLKVKMAEALGRSGTMADLPFKVHDFGYRGSSSIESAALAGAAHLVNFLGTDTIAGIELLCRHYGADFGDKMPGFSVPAAEHSTITSWGRDGELQAYQNILDQYPTGIVSVVSDSYNIFEACERYWGGELKDAVATESGRTLVVRPDSGDPLRTITRCLLILGQCFGYRENEQGFRVLPDYIRLIQGDGINMESLPRIVDGIMEAGWSLDNLVFGSGGGLRDCNRDTQSIALKCNWIDRDGEIMPISKDPISSAEEGQLYKGSKAGQIKLVQRLDGEFETVPADDHRPDRLIEVFRNGALTQKTTIENIRRRAELVSV